MDKNQAKIAGMVLEALTNDPAVRAAVVGAIDESMDKGDGFGGLADIQRRVMNCEEDSARFEGSIFGHAWRLERLEAEGVKNDE